MTLEGAGVDSTTLQAPASPASGSIAGLRSVVTVLGGARVAIERLKVAGPRSLSCSSPSSLTTGILVAQDATLDLHSAAVDNVRDTPATCLGPETTAIEIGVAPTGRKSSAGPTSPGHATITDDGISGYGDVGIDVVGAGSTATISHDTVTGVGASPARFVIGVLVHVHSTATIEDNTIADNHCTSSNQSVSGSGRVCGPDPLSQTHDQGILAFKPGPGTVITGNRLSGNDVGIELSMESQCCTVSANILAGNLFFGLLIRDGNQNIIGETISGGRVGVGVVADKANTTATLQKVSITRTAVAPTQTFPCCGHSAHLNGNSS